MPRRRHAWSVLVAAAIVGACATGDGSEVAPIPTQVSTLKSARDARVAPIEVGVLTIRSAVDANAQYGAVARSLERDLERPVELVPLSHDDVFAATAGGLVDFVLTNPLQSAQLRRLHGTEILATVERRVTGTEFGGLIIARADGPVLAVEDIVGRHVGCVHLETAAGGCNFQLFHLAQRGIEVSDLGAITEIASQDNIVFALLHGDIDVGFIRTGQLERMTAEGLLTSVDSIRILDRRDGDYLYPHTTRLYPEWAFAAVPGVDPDLVSAVGDALLSFAPPADDDTARVTGFVPPLDYEPIEELIVALRLRSWDAT